MIWRKILTSEIWNSLIGIQNHFIDKLDQSGTECYEEYTKTFNQKGWMNRTWTSDLFRRSHLEVIDAREEKGLWIIHLCIFPHLNSNAPIFGLDIVSGKRKITGFFHDFSHTVDKNHPMIKEFENIVSKYEWKKERQLPDWAKEIFTENMIAAGNISVDDDLEKILKISKHTIGEYLEFLKSYQNNANPKDTKVAYNRYVHFQKQNPHVPRSLKSLGLDDESVKVFVEKCLFPDL